VVSGLYTLYEKYVHNVWAHRNPFLIIAVFLALIGVQSLFFGLLAEIAIRTYHESQDRPIYWVRERRNVKELRRRFFTDVRD
jgi:hypothetical protein